jgi:hypothetical protein
VQQYSYTTGKNATDSALIIDAMDILYTGRVDGFCIISSDSDFTRLATRLREAGMKVFGFGERKTPSAFISACDKFIYIEILKPKEEPVRHKASPPKSKSVKRSKAPVPEETEEPIGKISNAMIQLITDTINDVADENGWAFLGDVGNLLLKKQPDFDPRNYGFKKLVSLMKSIDAVEIDNRNIGKDNSSIQVYVRTKQAG